MGAAVPCLDYVSRTDAVVALRAQGLALHEIAMRIGITPKQASALEASRRRIRAQARDEDAGERLTVIGDLFPYHQKQLLRRHAAKRGITVNRLIQAIVDAVVAENLVDAVLDDAADFGGAA